MELNAFWGSLRRRWYLAVLAVLLSVAATYGAVQQVSPSYTAEGTVLLFPPSNSMTNDGHVVTDGNPYLFLGGLSPARDILVRVLNAKSTRAELAEQFPRAGYEVMPDFTGGGPIVLVTVTGASNADAIGMLRGVIRRVPQALATLQADLGIPKTAFITSKELTVDPAADVVRKSQVRAGIMAGGGVLAVCLLGIGLLDGLIMTRRRTAERAIDRPPDAPAADTPESRGSGRGQAAAPGGARQGRKRRRSTAPSPEDERGEVTDQVEASPAAEREADDSMAATR